MELIHYCHTEQINQSPNRTSCALKPVALWFNSSKTLIQGTVTLLYRYISLSPLKIVLLTSCSTGMWEIFCGSDGTHSFQFFLVAETSQSLQSQGHLTRRHLLC